MPPDRRLTDLLLRDFLHSFDTQLDDEPEEPMTTNCGEEHGKVVSRLDALEETKADHETRIREGEKRGAAIADKLIWLLINALVCGGVSVVAALIAAGAGG